MNPSDAIASLVAGGMTEQAIAAELNVNQTTINRIRRQVVTPSYETGKALVDLASTVARRARRRRATEVQAPNKKGAGRAA
jgi:IS30 family transposase